jgi:superfamily II DNA or RNA helicase
VTSVAAHLLYVPRSRGGPSLFVWPPGGLLTQQGQPGSALIVTGALAPERVEGHTVALAAALPVLATLAADDLDRAPASVGAWSLATKLALDLIARERIVPLPRAGASGGDVRWGVSLALPDDAERFRRLAQAMPPAAHAVPVDDQPSNGAGGSRAARVWPAEDLLLEFLDEVSALLVRDTASVDQAPPGARWEERFVRALTEADRDPAFLGAGVLDRGLLDELSGWATPARGALATRTPRLCLKLDLPGSEQAPWRLGYFLQAPDDPSLLLPAADIWASASDRMQWMDHTFAQPHELLLRELARAARLYKPIEASLDARTPAAARLDTPQAWQFLSDAAPLLGEAGFGVMLPAELAPAGQRRLRLRMHIGESPRGSGSTGNAQGLSLDTLLHYRWEAAVGDQALSAEEFRQLAALKRPLVQWRGQWVMLDPSEVAEVGRALKEGGGRMEARQALAVALGETLPAEGARPPVDVVAEGPLARLLERLREGVTPAAPPDDLVGELRPYQQRGLGWLSTMAALGLGGCLADDMGLGKTVQTIAYLLARRAAAPRDRRPTLIVCPMSVVGNWERELARFGPTLPVIRHHGPGRARTKSALGVKGHAVVVTTYATLRRDRALLGELDWGVAVLDEAQNVKNPASQQAAAARALRAEHRFALTGTPVENRLAELWSIFEFCVPGFLGPLEPFRRQYAIPIERYRDQAAAERLRRHVRPFILRRLKSDPGIAAELPPKQEMPMVCTLTREQATLYQAAVDDAMAKIEQSEGIERRGLVLALLTALKQVCNHPAHYLREKGPLPGRSGKLTRLTEMLEETVAAGDRALVFTQYREMGDRLVRHLQQTLGTEVLFLHGGVARAARDEMVRRFQEDPQAPPVFVLSLRAGGTGLNLTRATRVFHYDRWWNPAVEDQATDRAHRIGQSEVVQVYRLLAAGTLEENIDRMLADKRDLADRIVGAGETWITEMSDAELRSLVSLSGDATVGDEDGE